MKNLFFVLFLLISLPVYAQSTMEREMTMDDGVMVNGRATPVGAVKNMTATKSILDCMQAGRDRAYCQCTADNIMDGLSASQVLALRGDAELFQDKIKAAIDHCAEEPRSKIPPIVTDRAMTGGEIRTYFEKEVLLDCLEAGNRGDACKCSMENMSSLEMRAVMNYLKIIDTRKINVMSYIPDNKEVYVQVMEIYKKCGVTK